MNCENPDPELKLNVVRETQEKKLQNVIINSHALGGINTVLRLKKV